MPTVYNGESLHYDSSHKIRGEDALKDTGLRCYGFSHYRFGAKSVDLLRDKLAVYGKGHGAARRIYDRISGYLVDREGTTDVFSGSFQQSVKCLESCPASASASGA